MDMKLSVERLPDSIRQVIAHEHSIGIRLDSGEKLEDILRNPAWAEEWITHRADYYQLEVLKGILIRYAGLPFDLESLIKAIGEACFLTGAEIRVAVAKLRRHGIVFSVRKAWGDQLLYIPGDTIPIWQPLLLPGRNLSLPETAKTEISHSSKGFRLPLSLEMLSAWQEFDRQPLTWTTKGKLHRHPLVRMESGIHLTSGELASLSMSYPHNDQLPAFAALALELGLHGKVLRREKNEIRLSALGLSAWLDLTPTEADCRLHEWLMTWVGEIDPTIHLTASALFAMNELEWYEDTNLSVTTDQERMIDVWLGLMESFGWLERGSYRGSPVFRKKTRLRFASGHTLPESPAMFIQPDGEIFVPPNAPLKQRWILSEIADFVTADTLVVYQLTRNACMRAFHAGYTVRSILSFLEQGAAIPLPEPVSRALEDWFSPLGKVKFVEAMLLRTVNQEVAETLKQDPETAEKLSEQIGDYDFIIDPGSYPFLLTRLQKLGYPALAINQIIPAREESLSTESSDEESVDQGWIYRRHALSVFEADRAMLGAEQLFPGMSSIPATWLSKPRTYHASTSKELIQRAIDWQTSIQLKHNGDVRTFHPKGFQTEGEKWSVFGLWSINPNLDGSKRLPDSVRVQADEIAEVMIVLPSLEELETH